MKRSFQTVVCVFRSKSAERISQGKPKTNDLTNERNGHNYEIYFGRRGGEIWRKDSISGDISLVARLSTDGIPDVVCTICATDGKTLVVSYKTYKDFDNVHNGYAQSGHDSAEEDGDRYAVIDLQTGVVYKNEYYEP